MNVGFVNLLTQSLPWNARNSLREKLGGARLRNDMAVGGQRWDTSDSLPKASLKLLSAGIKPGRSGKASRRR